MDLNQLLDLVTLILAPVVIIGGGIGLIIKIDNKFHLNKVQVTLLGTFGALLLIVVYILWSIYIDPKLSSL